MSLTNRLQKLRQELAKKQLDGLFVSKTENLYYLSGFDGSDGFLLITARDAILATDFRYTEQAKRQAPDYTVFRISGQSTDWFPHLIAGHEIKRLGFESGHITVALHQQLTSAVEKGSFPPELVAMDGIVESLRGVKEIGEIELIKSAAAISDLAIEHITDVIHLGMTELEAAWEIERFMREQGSQTLPFAAIVAAGSNSALPHAKPSERAIMSGEPIVIDIGARIGGYGSDITRTLCLGSPDETFNQVYRTVLGAQLATIDGIRDGMTGAEADSIARQIIREAGYSEAFGHSLGHGVGLSAHELPRLGPGMEEPLTGSMVFTVEPGIYLNGWGGVRIEDTVVMENGKIKMISQAKKERV